MFMIYTVLADYNLTWEEEKYLALIAVSQPTFGVVRAPPAP